MFLFKKAQKSIPPPAPSPPSPPPPAITRTPTTHPPNPQSQSPLFKLPAELRNEIYHHLFTSTTLYLTGTYPLEPPNSNPLALLATCRKANYEATTLAYRTLTFQLPHPYPQGSRWLKSYIPRTPAPLRTSTTRLAIKLDQPRSDETHEIDAAGAQLLGALLLFPALEHCSITIPRFGTPRHEPLFTPQLCTCAQAPGVDTETPTMASTTDDLSTAVFREGVISHAISGHGHAWQAGETWRVERSVWTGVSAWCDATNEWVGPRWKAGGWGEACACGGSVALAAGMVQEGGRRVAVEVGFCGGWEKGDEVWLVPGVEAARGFVERGDGTAMGFEPGEEYWGELRGRRSEFFGSGLSRRTREVALMCRKEREV